MIWNNKLATKSKATNFSKLLENRSSLTKLVKASYKKDLEICHPSQTLAQENRKWLNKTQGLKNSHVFSVVFLAQSTM